MRYEKAPAVCRPADILYTVVYWTGIRVVSKNLHQTKSMQELENMQCLLEYVQDNRGKWRYWNVRGFQAKIEYFKIHDKKKRIVQQKKFYRRF
jgi:hypothetical protein